MKKHRPLRPSAPGGWVAVAIAVDDEDVGVVEDAIDGRSLPVPNAQPRRRESRVQEDRVEAISLPVPRCDLFARPLTSRGVGRDGQKSQLLDLTLGRMPHPPRASKSWPPTISTEDIL